MTGRVHPLALDLLVDEDATGMQAVELRLNGEPFLAYAPGTNSPERAADLATEALRAALVELLTQPQRYWDDGPRKMLVSGDDVYDSLDQLRDYQDPI